MRNKKRFPIPKKALWQAFDQSRKFYRVGVDGQTIRNFALNRRKRIHQLWQQLSSGHYDPSPVRIVYKPKHNGGRRMAGILTVKDNIVQNMLTNQFYSRMQGLYHPHSYWRIRPVELAKKKAIEMAGKRCLRYNWALVTDITKFSANIDHRILMNMLRKYFRNPWVLHYTYRLLKAPRQEKNGTLAKPKKGLLHDIKLHVFLVDFYLHDIFDQWMKKNHPDIPFERFIDDIIIHCHSESKAKALRYQIQNRFRSFKLMPHPKKTKIVYCKDGIRKGNYKNVSFRFLESTFRSRRKKSRFGNRFYLFGPS